MTIKRYRNDPRSEAERLADARVVALELKTRAAVEAFLRDMELVRQERALALADQFDISAESARELWDNYESQLV